MDSDTLPEAKDVKVDDDSTKKEAHQDELTQKTLKKKKKKQKSNNLAALRAKAIGTVSSIELSLSLKKSHDEKKSGNHLLFADESDEDRGEYAEMPETGDLPKNATASRTDDDDTDDEAEEVKTSSLRAHMELHQQQELISAKESSMMFQARRKKAKKRKARDEDVLDSGRGKDEASDVEDIVLDESFFKQLQTERQTQRNQQKKKKKLALQENTRTKFVVEDTDYSNQKGVAQTLSVGNSSSKTMLQLVVSASSGHVEEQQQEPMRTYQSTTDQARYYSKSSLIKGDDIDIHRSSISSKIRPDKAASSPSKVTWKRSRKMHRLLNAKALRKNPKSGSTLAAPICFVTQRSSAVKKSS